MNREQAIAQLAKSQRGRNALRRLLEWLDDDGLGLDQHNQEAVYQVLAAAWCAPGSTRDLMREAIAEI